jgi:hypothetical protein
VLQTPVLPDLLLFLTKKIKKNIFSIFFVSRKKHFFNFFCQKQ